MNNIYSCLLRWINDKGYYSQSYGENHKMPEISIPVDNCGSQNKNNVIIRFLNMIKEGGFSGIAILHFYINGYIKNDFDRTFNRLLRRQIIYGSDENSRRRTYYWPPPPTIRVEVHIK